MMSPSNEAPFRVSDNRPATRKPFHGGTCYACNEKAVGFRNRRPEGGSLEIGCKRHADPTILTYDACVKCLGPVRKGSLDLDGMYWHKKCHQEDCA